MSHFEETAFTALTNGDRAQAQKLISEMSEAERLNLYNSAVEIAAMTSMPGPGPSPAHAEDADREMDAVVNRQLDAVAQVPFGSDTGRRFELQQRRLGGTQLTAEEARAQIKIVILDIARRVGIGFVEHIDPIALDQFVVVSIAKNHDTAGLIRSLIRSFMSAYSDPKTNSYAYGMLEDLEEVQRTLLAQYARQRAKSH